MKTVCALGITTLLASSAAAATPALEPGGAAVVGGWSGDGQAVQGIVLQQLAPDAPCARLGSRSVLISDHQTPTATAVHDLYRLTPGRYALVGVQWTAPYFDQYAQGGVSPQAGDVWVVDIRADAVTNLGIWPVTSPYEHRYVLGTPDLEAAQKPAQAAAQSVGPLVTARWERMPVAALDAACPGPSK